MVGLVYFGLVWFSLFGWLFGWFGLVWVVGLVYFGLVWFSLGGWFGLVCLFGCLVDWLVG